MIRRETDEEVRQNLEQTPGLVELFNRVRGSIKGNDRESRTEAFMCYVEEHPLERLLRDAFVGHSCAGSGPARQGR